MAEKCDLCLWNQGSGEGGGGGGGGSSGGGVLVVHMQYDTETQIGTLDKTYSEIANADFAVLSGFEYDGGVNTGYVYRTYYDEGYPAYAVAILSGTSDWIGVTSTENGYPEFDFS